KKAFTTPLKEKSRREKALKKAEETVEKLEQQLSSLEAQLSDEAIQSDYIKLEELQKEASEVSCLLEEAMLKWEELAQESEI
ncbi:MAG: hypothetical protein IKB94_07350, partial [Clostridia bacterium]|nr:hypothetical protein [Clostridia bacterium]